MKTLFHILLTIVFGNELWAQSRTEIQHKIASEILMENRYITVGLPKYYESSVENYGVVYVLDGEYAFDYAQGAVSFLSNAFGHMPPLLVVSIPNVDRVRDMYVNYEVDGGYLNFLAFIKRELMPFINQNYRTNQFDILYGWSSSSNINMQFLANDPDLFDAHIQTGTGIGAKTAAYFNEKLPQNTYEKCYLYASTEKGPRVPGLLKYEQVVKQAERENLTYKFQILDDASHVGAITEGLYEGLRFIFDEFYIPDTIVVKGKNEILDYYYEIDERYHFEIKIPEGAIGESAGLLFQAGNPDDAIALLRHGMKLHPHSYDLPGTLAEVYEYLDKKDLAAELYLKASQKAKTDSPSYQKYKHLYEKVKVAK
ncbi:MAG: alpha/beta hydrolase-fold protein [Reichenbachiella sp.]|uniref:alpha/beta hydrolase-fold protein n=1 Tax=Reichenbachiella sp. TaxID=2184521 RepID=UPI0032677F16